MAGVKISALPALPSSQLTDIAPFVQGGTTYGGTNSQLATLFNAQLTFLPLAGGTLTGALNMGGFKIDNMADPTLAQDAATKNYVDNIATGGGAPVVAASTAALTVTYSNGVAGVGATLTNAGTQATFALDGQTPAVGARVLIKNQASTLQNGVYTVTNAGSGATNWVLTRATDYDTPADINDTGTIPVTAGTVNANTGWYNSTTMVTVGTTAITFVQFGVSYPVSVANGGTGATTAAAALVNLGLGTPTGTGNVVLATSPTLVTPALGTPASGIATNLTATGGLRSFQVFTSGTAATYTKPANVTSILVEMVGGGGGGGGCASGAAQGGAASGGAGGGYIRSYIASAAATYTYTVGAGGAGGTAGNNNGTAGGNSTFSTFTASGGAAGIGSAVSASAGQYTAATVGGTASGGSIFNTTGGSGGAGFVMVASGAGTSVGGSGGNSFCGSGAASIGTAPGAGAGNGLNGNSSIFGVGGSGGCAASSTGNASGGAGVGGIIIVWEFS